MTRSLTKELFIPFKNSEREFHSFRNLFKTLSLDESSSPKFDLFSDLEENSEEVVADKMAESMEEYMCKTRGDYGSGVARPKINDKDHFELKCQFLNELRDNTFSASDHEDASEHIEKVLEIAEVILFYNGLEVPTRQILDSKGAIPTKTAVEVKVAIQEMASQKWHNETSRIRSTETFDGLAVIQAQLNNLGREIKKVNEKVYVALVSPYGVSRIDVKDHSFSSNSKIKLLLFDSNYCINSMKKSQASVKDSFSCWKKARISSRSRLKRARGKNQGKHHQANSFFLGVSIFKHITYSVEFVNVFVRIGFGSTIKLVSIDESQVVTFNDEFVFGLRKGDCGTKSRSDNMVGSPLGFVIHGIDVLKGNDKVTEVIDVEN
uniref:Uncharacterized protein n=1 Tax=Tanacetum cinerariifolium TaxID=118510 RepID=A0A699GLX5_TANCI|nr:hypothetical protein [Tanacetum cinerariifolium]